MAFQQKVVSVTVAEDDISVNGAVGPLRALAAGLGTLVVGIIWPLQLAKQP